MGWLRDFWDEWTAPGYAEDQMARAGEDYEDFFAAAPLPDSALDAMVSAMETGVPQTWVCEHGRRHLSGLFVDRDRP